MDKELVIDVDQENVNIALLEDSKLVELSQDVLTQQFVVGNIYLGRVKKIMKGLNAAFVDIGHEKEAFIHYHDLGAQFDSLNDYLKQILNDRKHAPVYHKLPDIDKNGTINNLLEPGQYILVQIVKEPINTKGPRLTGEISIAGRNMVFLPTGDKVSVSQKIKSKEERTRLRQLTHSIKPQDYSVILRTVAEDIRVAQLDGELKHVIKRWTKCINNIKKSKGVCLLLEEQSRVVSIIRDLFTPEYKNIHINNKELFEEVSQYVELIAPEGKDIVKYYTDELPIFDSFAITKQIKALFGRTVSFKRGAYLILDQAEAMHVIDVNSGTRTKSSQTQEENTIEVNLLAATEIARQLRLRDMGGIIVIDFIDMMEGKHRQALYDHMCNIMSADRARHNILPLSKFGLMQITRQRVRPALIVETNETCPTCFGTGKAKPSILFTDQLESQIDFLVNQKNIEKLTIEIHPYVYAYIDRGWNSLKRRWKRKYTRNLTIKPVQKFGFLQYQFKDADGIPIKLK